MGQFNDFYAGPVQTFSVGIACFVFLTYYLFKTVSSSKWINPKSFSLIEQTQSELSNVISAFMHIWVIFWSIESIIDGYIPPLLADLGVISADTTDSLMFVFVVLGDARIYTLLFQLENKSKIIAKNNAQKTTIEEFELREPQQEEDTSPPTTTPKDQELKQWIVGCLVLVIFIVFFALFPYFRFFFTLALVIVLELKFVNRSSVPDPTIIPFLRGMLWSFVAGVFVENTWLAYNRLLLKQEPNMVIAFFLYEVFSLIILAVFYFSNKLICYDTLHQSLQKFIKQVIAYAVLYYSWWVIADIVIQLGADFGWVIRVLPNQLYYGFTFPAVYYFWMQYIKNQAS